MVDWADLCRVILGLGLGQLAQHHLVPDAAPFIPGWRQDVGVGSAQSIGAAIHAERGRVSRFRRRTKDLAAKLGGIFAGRDIQPALARNRQSPQIICASARYQPVDLVVQPA